MAVSTLRRLRSDGRGWVLVAVAVGWFFGLGVRVVVPAVLPQVRAEFALSNAAAGFAITVLWLLYALTQFPSGLIIDRAGERVLLAASMGVATASVALFALAPVFVVFLAACALFGIGTGLYGPPRTTLLTRVFPENDGTALGITFGSGSVGAAVLPPVAGALAVVFGWRAGFLALVPAFALITLVLWRVLPRGAPGDGAGLAASRESVRRLASGVTRRSVLLSTGGFTLVVFVFQGLSAFMPTYLIEVKGLDQGLATLLYGAFFATSAAVQPIAGGVADRVGRRPTLAATAAIHVVALVGLVVASGPLALAGVAVLLGFRGGIAAPNNAYILAALPADVEGSAYGLIRTGYLVLASSGSAFVGVLADAGYFDGAFLVLAGVAGVATALYLAMPGQSPASTP